MKDLDTVGFISNMQVVIGRAENDIEWAKIRARTKKNAWVLYYSHRAQVTYDDTGNCMI